MPTQRLDFLVRRDRIGEHRLAPGREPAPLSPGEAELVLDLFGLTANNITYAVAGDSLGYWKFFPHPEPDWGRVPVWGFGVVARSAADGVAEGERFYGYFPMSTHLTVRPERVDGAAFVDGTPHRAALHAIYNRYRRTGADPNDGPEAEAEQVLLRPLFGTSFLLDDFLVEQDFLGAETVLVSSASSKTAWGMAFLLGRRRARELVGLTSARHVEAVSRMGVYDRVLPYEELASLPGSRPTVYVDFAGGAALRDAVRRHFGGALRRCIVVGSTHREQPGVDILGSPEELFFAPSHFARRAQELTPAILLQRIADAWRTFLDPARVWLALVRGRGPQAIARAYEELAAGRARPDRGHVLSFE